MDLNFNDFEKQDIKFDIDKLKEAYHEILKKGEKYSLKL